jgi:hypothetical protein
MHPTQTPSGTHRPPRPRRRRYLVETDEFGCFARRIVAAYGRRVAACDIEALTDLVDLATEVDNAITHAVTGLRGCGYSWADIAARLGITRQSAHERWGDAR